MQITIEEAKLKSIFAEYAISLAKIVGASPQEMVSPSAQIEIDAAPAAKSLDASFRPQRKEERINAQRYLIARAIEARPATTTELAARFRVSEATVRNRLHELRAAGYQVAAIKKRAAGRGRKSHAYRIAVAPKPPPTVHH